MAPEFAGPKQLTIAILLAAALDATPPAASAPNLPPATPSASSPAAAPTHDAPAAVTSYPPGFFAAVQPNTALDMVNDLPGFTLDLGDAVRGFGGAAGNVLVDGERPASKSDPLDEVLKRIPARSVARIDLIRGGAPGIDMQGKTVIANVVEVSDDGLKLTTAAAVNLLSTGRALPSVRLEGTKRSGQTTFEGGFLWGLGGDDGTGAGKRTVTNGAGQVTQTGYEHTYGQNLTAKLTGSVETPVMGGKLRVEGSYLASPYAYTDDDALLAPPGHEFEHYDQSQDTAELGLRYEHPLGPRSSLETYALQQLAWYGYADNFKANDFGAPASVSHFGLSKRSGESILRTTWKFTPTPALAIEGGAEGDYNWLNSRTALSSNGAPIAIPAANVQVTEKRGEAFATATWRIRPTLTLETGVRVEGSQIGSSGDVVSSKHFVFAKPRAVVTWSPDAADQVRVRLEREVSQLNFDDFTASGSLGAGAHAGNPQLTPQRDWVIEAAYERRFWGGADASVTLRRYWYSDVIDRAPACAASALLAGHPPACDPAQEFDAPANVGNGFKDELAVALTLPTDKLALKGGLLTLRSTWRRSGVTDPSTHRMREISGLHPVDAEAHFTQGLPFLKSTWGFDLFTGWRASYYRFNEVDTDRLATWLDVYLEYKPRPDLAIRGELDNAADHGFEHIRQFYDPFRDAPGAALAATDHRFPHFGPELFLRARKTFG
jgi:hypothetical protein